MNRLPLIIIAIIATWAAATPSAPAVPAAQPAPVIVGSPPGEVAALQTKIADLEAKLVALQSHPTSIPSAACQCKVCDCDPCDCREPKAEKLPVLSRPVVVPLAGRVVCSGGACRYVPVQAVQPKRYVPQTRRALLPWRR